MDPSRLMNFLDPRAHMRRIAAAGLAAAVSAAPIVRADLHAQQRTISRASLPRKLDSALRVGELKMVDSVRSAPLPSTAARVPLQRGQFLAARVAAAPRLDLRRPPLGMSGGPGTPTIDSVLVLPFDYFGVTRDDRPIHLRPAIIRESPLRYRPHEGVFRGSLLITLEDSLAPAVRKELSGAIRLTLVSRGDSIAPGELELAFTNRPLTRVTIIAEEPRDSLSVQVVPEFDLRGTVVWLPVDPVLALDGAPKTIAGLGIQTASFPVRIRGASIGDSIPVTLAVDRGSLVHNEVKVGRSGSATVRLRSAGIGDARLIATSPGMNAVQATIRFGWPVVFLVAALLGGAIGGLVGEVTRTKESTARRGAAVLVGLLVGFVVAVAYYAVGVNLLGFDVEVPYFDEAAVFGLALLGGAFGIRVLKAKES
jgi:hypothetical protein